MLATTCEDGRVRVWDVATRKQIRTLDGHEGNVLPCCWRADGRILASAGTTDGTVRLWDMSNDTPNCKVIQVIPPGARWLHGLAFTSEGRYLATANPDGTVYVLKLAGRP